MLLEVGVERGGDAVSFRVVSGSGVSATVGDPTLGLRTRSRSQSHQGRSGRLQWKAVVPLPWLVDTGACRGVVKQKGVAVRCGVGGGKHS